MKCPTCSGTGRVRVAAGGERLPYEVCPDCRGDGGIEHVLLGERSAFVRAQLELDDGTEQDFLLPRRLARVEIEVTVGGQRFVCALERVTESGVRCYRPRRAPALHS